MAGCSGRSRSRCTSRNDAAGDYTSPRFSPLTQITAATAPQLAAQWTFQTGVVSKFEATPIVLDGTIYITGVLDHASALDGKTGKPIWHYQRFPGTAPPAGLKSGMNVTVFALPAARE